ncbi:uncharacterized protein LOC111051237 isoform X2 [Nilaparvata lugens]|uniref:uncharacterized protein LOC111051237 isoform X2 n=1 Tax=Nilaparvata lugens TaxID=108931 RepID=UPI00193D21FE|nr:uncharacterized protein LOC111051237 isoform X2 [Nilaparvata lugens]
MMYKLCSIVLVISVSANLGTEIPPLPVLHVDNSNNPTIQTPEIPALTSAGISANLFEPLSSLCREWETVKFNDKEISDLKKIQREEAFTIKTGDFKDHKLIPGKNSGSDRACPCHIQGKLCIPLCCLSDQMPSLDDGKLTCVNKTADPNLWRNFAKHLRVHGSTTLTVTQSNV